MTRFILILVLMGLFSVTGISQGSSKPKVTPEEAASATYILGQNIEATTKDGREVILKKNGTWVFKTPKELPKKTPPTVSTKSPFITGDEYTLLSRTKEVTYGYAIYYQVWRLRKDVLDNVSGWLKYIPNNTTAFVKKHKVPAKTSYFLQFTTADCADRRLSTETIVFYDEQGNPLPSPNSFLLRNYGEPVVPGSVNESILEGLCSPAYIRVPGR